MRTKRAHLMRTRPNPRNPAIRRQRHLAPVMAALGGDATGRPGVVDGRRDPPTSSGVYQPVTSCCQVRTCSGARRTSVPGGGTGTVSLLVFKIVPVVVTI